MSIGLSLYALQSAYGDREALRIANEIGYDTVDFNLAYRDFRREGDIYSKPYEEFADYYSEIADYASKIGIVISQTHGRMRAFIPDESENAAVIENARLDCLATMLLKAPVTVMHSISTCRFGPDFPDDRMRQLNFEMFSNILAVSEPYGVGIALETFGDSPDHGCCDFFGSAQELLNCFIRLRTETKYGSRLSLCVDTGHSNKATRFGHPKPSDVIRLFGKNISCLHLNDNDTLTDQHKPPLTGSVDWADVMQALSEVGYSGTYNMEVDLTCFGKKLMLPTAEFSLKLMQSLVIP